MSQTVTSRVDSGEYSVATRVKDVPFACPHCPTHPEITADSTEGDLLCLECNTHFAMWDGKPSFLSHSDGLDPAWSDSYNKSKSSSINNFLLNVQKTLAPPRIRIGTPPHFELLKKLRVRGDFKVLFVGYSQPFDDELSRNVIQLDIVPREYVDLVAMGEYIPFPNNSFDLVVMSGVIEHVLDPFRVVVEAHRVVKSGGTLYVSSPWMYPFHGGDNYRFSYEGLRLLCNQFNEVTIGSLNGPWHTLGIGAMHMISHGLSFGNKYIRSLLALLMAWIVLPLMLLDAITNRRSKPHPVLDANIYAIAKKTQNNANL